MMRKSLSEFSSHVMLSRSCFTSFCVKKLGGDLYILPSSVHEVILIPKTKDLSVKELNRIGEVLGVEPSILLGMEGLE